MSTFLHAATAPVFVRMLQNMNTWLAKAQAHAEARHFDPNNYLGMRLAPDMLPFSRQVQIASDNAKGCMARLAGLDVPKWEDNEASLAELQQRVMRTIEFVQSVSAQQFEGAESRAIVLPVRQGDPLRFTGEAYVKHAAMPNFYFHATMSYALLRHAGVEVGKKDFLGG